MEQVFVEEKTFEKIDYSLKFLQKAEYEKCVFINCNFSEANLADIKFSECEFIGCNLSLAKIAKTAFRDVKFKDSKMLGLHFETCNQFGFAVYIENCILNHSTFYRTKLKQTIFRNTQVREVDFTECDLTGSIFDNCDLSLSTFDTTIIEQVDFRTSYNYSIDPEINRIKKAKFSISGIAGLLDKYDIEIDGVS